MFSVSSPVSPDHLDIYEYMIGQKLTNSHIHLFTGLYSEYYTIYTSTLSDREKAFLVTEQLVACMCVSKVRLAPELAVIKNHSR